MNGAVGLNPPFFVSLERSINSLRQPGGRRQQQPVCLDTFDGTKPRLLKGPFRINPEPTLVSARGVDGLIF